MKSMGEEKKAKKEDEDMEINCLDTRIMVMWTKVSDTQGLNLCLKPAVVYQDCEKLCGVNCIIF